MEKRISDDTLCALMAGSYEQLTGILEGLITERFGGLFEDAQAERCRVVATFPTHVIAASDRGEFRKIRFHLEASGEVCLGLSESVDVALEHPAALLERAAVGDAYDEERHRLLGEAAESVQVGGALRVAKLLDSEPEWMRYYKEQRESLAPLLEHVESSHTMYATLPEQIHALDTMSLELHCARVEDPRFGAFVRDLGEHTEALALGLQEMTKLVVDPSVQDRVSSAVARVLPTYTEACRLVSLVAQAAS